ncbi:hypothetical protein ACLKA6_015869 [Drosophila palustris]
MRWIGTPFRAMSRRTTTSKSGSKLSEDSCILRSCDGEELTLAGTLLPPAPYDIQVAPLQQQLQRVIGNIRLPFSTLACAPTQRNHGNGQAVKLKRLHANVNADAVNATKTSLESELAGAQCKILPI